ncbi:unnamed protein product [Symbiodinium sp. CCMP2456]|nr:unnamed protein product [Symbiodinium sp. CCMP2456]
MEQIAVVDFAAMDVQSRVTLFMNKVSHGNLERFAEAARKPAAEGDVAMNLASGDVDLVKHVADCIVAHSLWSGLKHSSTAVALADILLALDSPSPPSASEKTPSLSSFVVDAVLRDMGRQFSQRYEDCEEKAKEDLAVRVKESAKAVARSVGQLFNKGLCPFVKFDLILQGISHENAWLKQDAAAYPEAEPCTPGLPQCVLLSGRVTASQPRVSETVAEFKDRLASDLGVGPSTFFFLMAGGEPQPHEEMKDLGQVELQVMVRPPVLKEEYRVEAVCILLTEVAATLQATEHGKALLCREMQRLGKLKQGLSKRYQFMIKDLEDLVASV